MAESEFVSFLKPWIDKPFDQLSPEVSPRGFASVWDEFGENERLKAERNAETAFELGFRQGPDRSRKIDAQLIDIYAWEISRFGIAEGNAPPREPVNDGREGPLPEIPAWLSPMELAAYAATDNPWLVARCAPGGSGLELDQLEFRAVHSRSLSPTKVLEKAVGMLRAGKIVMTALRDGVRREMPVEDWRYWTFRTSPVDKNTLVVCDVTTSELVVGWTNFLISREQADLVRAALLGREPTSLVTPHVVDESGPTPTSDERSQTPAGMDAPPAATEMTPGAQEVAMPRIVRHATDQMIDEQITFVYNYATQRSMKPPNIKEISHPVRVRLISQGLSVTLARIETLAELTKHKQRRRDVGVRVNDSLPAFSWPEIWKSGGEE
jgi:hypothetical protein